MSGGDYHSSSSTAAGDHDHRLHHHPSVMHVCRRRCKRINAGSISNLCSATLGAGALSLPFAISLTGIVFGILLLVFSAYLTIVSIDVIIEACRRTQLFKYEDVSVRLVGKGAGRVLEASLLVFCFGVSILLGVCGLIRHDCIPKNLIQISWIMVFQFIADCSSIHCSSGRYPRSRA